MPANFQVPRAYAELHAAGRFQYWPAPYREMTKEARAAHYQANRRQRLWVGGIEWLHELSPAALVAAPENPAALPGLVRFAEDGAGDAYCWYLPWQDGPEPPVLICPHDDTEARYLAPDFAHLCERLWLDHGANSSADAGRADTLLDLGAWLGLFGPYLPAGRAQKLAALVVTGAPPASFAAARERLVASFPHGSRKLPHHDLMPTQYEAKFFKQRALKLLDESIAFYQDLVAQGHTRFTAQLAEATANRAKAAAELAGSKKKQ